MIRDMKMTPPRETRGGVVDHVLFQKYMKPIMTVRDVLIFMVISISKIVESAT